MRLSRMSALVCVCALVTCSISNDRTADEQDSVQLIGQAVSAKPGSGVAEISTEELEQILEAVIDTLNLRDQRKAQP